MLPIKAAKFRVRIFIQANGIEPFTVWIKSLDGTVRARINARIARFEDGLFGDSKSLGDQVMEARFFFGPGYRVYFAICGDQIILLLSGGDKSTQANDIIQAKQFLKLYLEDANANPKS